MSKPPLISVLLANYNNAPYLREAIESVRLQPYENWEIVVVDDASTDDSLAVLNVYADDPRIRVVSNDQNRGCGYTKRRCAELARGELCAYLDPDDALLPEALETMVKAHAEHPECALVYSKYFHCDKRLNVRSPSTHQCALPNGVSYLEYASGAVSSFAVFKRAAYERTPGIDARFMRAVDQDLYLKLEESGPLVFLDRPLYLYRAHQNNISLGHNSVKAFSWQLMAICSACTRRGKNPEQVLPRYFNRFTDTRAEWIGKRILAPLRMLRNLHLRE